MFLSINYLAVSETIDCKSERYGFIMFSAFYLPEPIVFPKADVSLSVFFSVGVLLAAFLAVIFVIHWQKKKTAKPEILSGKQIKFF